jgi:hypothetical protein
MWQDINVIISCGHFLPTYHAKIFKIGRLLVLTHTVIKSTSLSDFHWTDGRKRCVWSPLLNVSKICTPIFEQQSTLPWSASSLCMTFACFRWTSPHPSHLFTHDVACYVKWFLKNSSFSRFPFQSYTKATPRWGERKQIWIQGRSTITRCRFLFCKRLL